VTPEGTFKYIPRDLEATFNETSDWCSSLGGSLPIFHSRDDVDFLAHTVLGQTSMDVTQNHAVWLGAFCSEGVCTWQDGIALEDWHSWMASLTLLAEECQGCCALVMWTDSDFKRISVRNCNETNRFQVCIVKEHSNRSYNTWSGEQQHRMESLNRKTSTKFYILFSLIIIISLVYVLKPICSRMKILYFNLRSEGETMP